MKSPYSTFLAAAAGVAAGTSAAAQTCQPHWTNDLPAPDGNEMRGLRVLDDGSGPMLYMGIAASTGKVARWDGASLALLGNATGFLPLSSSTGVYALEMFDDGSGRALHIGGTFTAVDGTPASGVAKWTGAGWQPLGQGTDGGVRALLVHDDGSGPALYAAGSFQQAGGVSASCVAEWDGQGWSSLGGGLSGGAGPVIGSVGYPTFPMAFALKVFDDGTGAALYVGGNFDHAGGVRSMSVARWDGSSWSPVGNGLSWNSGQGAVISLAVSDAIAGPSLYVGGQVNFGALNANPIVARWDGVAWHPVGAWLPGYYISSFAEADFGGVRTLHASIYPYATPPTQSSIFRLDGNEWVAIGETGAQPVRTLAAYNDGSGNHLLAGGAFVAVSGVPAPRLARWIGCGASCYPDCDGVGGLTAAVFGCFQTTFVAGDPYADCDQSGSLTVMDFGCFQTRFVAGCP